MFISRLISFFRDIILFCILVALVGIAYKRAYWYLLKHEKTMIHQLDHNFLHQIHAAQKQVRNAILIFEKKDKRKSIAQLQTVLEKMQRIEERYQKNSPGLVFLGPIATVSIVLKENQLENELLTLVEKTGLIISGKEKSNSFSVQKNTIDLELKKNKSIFSDLRKN